MSQPRSPAPLPVRRPRHRAPFGRVPRAPFALFALLAILANVACAPGAVSAQSDATVVYLVRHAERAEDGTSDPMISETGQARALLLAEMLRDAGITHVYSTDLRRTRATGEPTASEAGLSIEVYDPRDLAGFAERLKATPGRHLVLGHSNTTPELAVALGGDAHGEIAEMEYDRLYIVTLTDNGASTVLLRFGDRYTG
jgi:phosphohistidine phosphatase SixA